MRNFEEILEKFYLECLYSGAICVDVGAHGGRHTIPMARRVGPLGYVYAFEPIPGMAESLRQTISHEGLNNVEVISSALGVRDETAQFVIAVDNLEYSGLMERVYDTPTRLKYVDVLVRRLDRVVSLATPIHYMKIDTEGGEWGVLQGSKEIIRKWKPIISFEFGANSYAKYGVDPLEVYKYLADFGYQLLDIDQVPLDAEQFKESSIRQDVWDYLALPK